MKIKQQTKSVLIIMALTIVIYGCNRTKFPDLEEEIQNIENTKMHQTIKPVLTQPQSYPSTYQATNLKSPFGQKEVVKTATEVQGMNPLQAYPLSMLRFIGVVTESLKTVAYVKTPDNMVYQVQVGDAIGDGDGRVSAIYPDRIDITETEIEKDNSQAEHVITLQLKDQQ